MKTINNGTEKFESLKEFVDHLNRGDEIEFRYENHIYMITHPNGKLALYEPNNESSEYQLESIIDLLNFKIGSNQIRNIVEEFEVISTLF